MKGGGMSRYNHYLRRASRDVWPPRVLVVSCSSSTTAAAPDSGYRVASLETWHAISLLRKEGAYVHHSESTGTAVAAFWQWIDSVLTGGGTTLLLSPRCAQVWALLGVWEEMESGRIRFGKHGADLRNARADAVRRLRLRSADPLGPISTGTVQRMLESSTGLLVCDDPPNILRCWRSGSPGLLEWIDTRNHGAECPDCERPGAPAARWAARWLISLSSALSSLNMGSIRATAGSQALHGWRRGYHYPGVLVHNHAKALALEGAAYYGGRCECLRIGTMPGVCYNMDVRSMYPWVMASFDLPVRLHRYHDDSAAALDACRRNALACCARVTVRTKSPDYPYRREKDVIYPIGQFTTVLPGPELRQCLDAGRIIQVYAAAEYVMGRPLQQYAEALYGMRCRAEAAGDKALAASAKSYLVSLPGKLAQKEKQWVAAPEAFSDLRYGVWYGADKARKPCRYRAIAGFVQREVVGGWGAESVPATAAWVTSYARSRLLSELERIGRKHVYYIDTDSLIVSEKGYAGIVGNAIAGGASLGALTVRATYQVCEVRGIKYYVGDSECVCAGIPRSLGRDEGGKEHYERPSSPWECIARNERPGATTVRCEVGRYPAYAHGNVMPGGLVAPFRLEE